MIDAFEGVHDENQRLGASDLPDPREVEAGDEVQVDVAPATTLNAGFKHVGIVVELWKTSDGDRQAIIWITRSLEEVRIPDAPRSCYNGCRFVTRPWSAKDRSSL